MQNRQIRSLIFKNLQKEDPLISITKYHICLNWQNYDSLSASNECSASAPDLEYRASGKKGFQENKKINALYISVFRSLRYLLYIDCLDIVGIKNANFATGAPVKRFITSELTPPQLITSRNRERAPKNCAIITSQTLHNRSIAVTL